MLYLTYLFPPPYVYIVCKMSTLEQNISRIYCFGTALSCGFSIALLVASSLLRCLPTGVIRHWTNAAVSRGLVSGTTWFSSAWLVTGCFSFALLACWGNTIQDRKTPRCTVVTKKRCSGNFSDNIAAVYAKENLQQWYFGNFSDDIAAVYAKENLQQWYFEGGVGSGLGLCSCVC